MANTETKQQPNRAKRRAEKARLRRVRRAALRFKPGFMFDQVLVFDGEEKKVKMRPVDPEILSL